MDHVMREFEDMSTDDILTAVRCLEKGVMYLKLADELVTGDILDYAFDYSAIEMAIKALKAALEETF